MLSPHGIDSGRARCVHGIILIGAISVTSRANTTLTLTLGLIAVLLATINMVGGFVVTDRMLDMFRAKPAGRDSARKQEKPQ